MRDLVTTFRRVKANKLLVAGLFTMAVLLTGVGVYQFNQTAAEAADCRNQTNNIVPQGIWGHGDIAKNYHGNTCGDVKAIFDHYWIKPDLAPGQRVVEGQANNRGEVVAEGRVVANNASSIGRQQIAHSNPISIAGKTYYETTHVGGKAFANPGSSLAALVILDAQGNFVNAIVKDCGNPIYAQPVPPPTPPKPPVKDIQVCELSTKRVITIREDQFNPQLHSKNLEDCKEVKIQVCELATKKVITINEDEFDAAKHSKNLDDCKEVMIQVCELDTKKIITINEDDYDEAKYSKNFEDCKEAEKIIVCEVETGKVISIDKKEYDESRHSKDLSDCEKPEEPVAPTPLPELPKTGAGSILGAGVGLSAMGLSAYFYAASRRLF